MWDLPWPRVWAHVPCVARQILNHWTIWKLPVCSIRVCFCQPDLDSVVGFPGSLSLSLSLSLALALALARSLSLSLSLSLSVCARARVCLERLTAGVCVCVCVCVCLMCLVWTNSWYSTRLDYSICLMFLCTVQISSLACFFQFALWIHGTEMSSSSVSD